VIAGEDVDIVVPILNEASCVDELIDRLERACPGSRLIFVDNGSRDGTLEKLAARSAEVIRHARNEGYGKSLRDGIEAGRRPVVLTIDADLEYPPETARRLLEALETCPVAYGSRFIPKPPFMSLTRRLGNQALTWLFNRVCDQRITDLYTGIKAFRRDAIGGRGFHESGFAFVVEFAIRASQVCRIADVPVDYCPRVKGRSKMRHLVEGFRAAAALWKYSRA
jgi:glycosyltransferase involved in cell wall biosynthesis